MRARSIGTSVRLTLCPLRPAVLPTAHKNREGTVDRQADVDQPYPCHGAPNVMERGSSEAGAVEPKCLGVLVGFCAAAQDEFASGCDVRATSRSPVSQSCQ